MTDALFAVDVTARTITGLVLPFDELSVPSIDGTEPVMFAAGTVTLPTDPAIVTLYDNDHDRHSPRGRATTVEATDKGIVATFAVAQDADGDKLLQRAQATPRPRLSAELGDLVRSGVRAVSARLTGVSVVGQGAFASAGLFAVAEDSSSDAVSPAPVEDTTTDEAPVTSDNAEGTEPEDDQEEEPMADAVVPGTLTAPGNTEKDTTTANGLFAAVAAGKGNPDALAKFKGGDALFAIANIQHSGPSAVTIGADVQVPNYVGELWKRRPYQRRFVPLLNHAPLTSYKVIGWQWGDGKEPEVGDYTGNAAEIASNAVDTEQKDATAQRIGGGHKIDRRYLDFNDQGVVASYFAHMVEGVARKTDAKALAAIKAAATATTPGTVPSGVAAGLAAIVDGALDVIATENRPSFALVDAALWRQIILTGKDEILGYLNAGFGLEEGSLEGFKILPATIGTAGNAGKQVIVGAKEALTFYELGGQAPIRVEGIDPHHGAIDPAVFAYWATLTNNAAAIRVVTTA